MSTNRPKLPDAVPVLVPALTGALLCLASLGLMLSVTVSSAQAQPVPQQEDSGGSSYASGELEMVEKINDYRQESDLSPLEVSDTASEAAAHHSQDMARHDFFSHDTRKSDYYETGADLADRMDEAGYDYDTYRSENIAAGYEDVETTLEQWKNSPEHNENMLNPELEVIGIGMACSEESSYGCYWTTDFGAHTPEEARTVEEIRGSGSDPEAGEGSSGATARPQQSTNEEEPVEQEPDEKASSDQYEGSSDGAEHTSSDTSTAEESSGETADSNRQVVGQQGEQSPTADQYGIEDGEKSSSGDETEEVTDEGSGTVTGQGECESATEGFDASPFEKDFGEKLQAAIDEEVSCKMEAAGVQSAEPGEDNADSSSEGAEGEQSTSAQDTSKESTSSGDVRTTSISKSDTQSSEDGSGGSASGAAGD